MMQYSLRVTHVDFSRDWRGGQQQLLLLARGLRRLGCPQTVVARPGPVSGAFQAEGFAVASPNSIAAWRAARAAEVVHAHDGHAHTWMLGVSLAHPGLRVLSRRVAYPIHGWASRWKYRRLDLALAVSECVRREVEAAGVPPTRVAVVPDAIEWETLPERAATRARVRHAAQPAAGAARWLVCLGAFSAEKGVGDLIAALALLPSDCHLWLPGTGPGRRALECQAAAAGLGGRVHFVADRPFTAAEWVGAADVFVMPSRQEGLGSAALLAMALGVPVVATDAGGIPELVHHDVTGLLVASANGDASNAAALASSCERVWLDPALAVRLTAAARERVRIHHDAAALASVTLAAYHRHLPGGFR